MKNFRDRIGIDVGRRLPAEKALDWAVANEVSVMDICLDTDPDLLLGGTGRSAAIRDRLGQDGIKLGLHSLSAVNMAETSPIMDAAVDEYMRTYVRAAEELGAGWVVVHAGFHFTKDKALRMAAGLERLKRTSAYAEERGITLLLENMNPEPADAEVKYLGHDIEECHYFFDQIDSPALRWSYTINHAHILPVGIRGFLDAMDLGRCSEVRVADCRGTIEEHLPIGEGTIDFRDAIGLLEGRGFKGHYTLGFTTLDDMLAGREKLNRIAAQI